MAFGQSRKSVNKGSRWKTISVHTFARSPRSRRTSRKLICKQPKRVLSCLFFFLQEIKVYRPHVTWTRPRIFLKVTAIHLYIFGDRTDREMVSKVQLRVIL